MRVAVSTPAHNLILYRRPLHPELFVMKGRKMVAGPAGIELECWLLPMGHMLRLTRGADRGGLCLCELVTDRDNGLPTQGVVTAFPAVGERDFEQLFEDAAVLYSVSAQTENLSPRLYGATLADMRALAKDTGAMIAEWPIEATPGARGSYASMGSVGAKALGDGGTGDGGLGEALGGGTGAASMGGLGTCLSMLEVQRFEDELHASSTHMHPGGGLVLRTQTVFARV